jgi:hypothetical protein
MPSAAINGAAAETFIGITIRLFAPKKGMAICTRALRQVC